MAAGMQRLDFEAINLAAEFDLAWCFFNSLCFSGNPWPGIVYEVHGTPKDLSGAKALADYDKYQFQWWAVSLVNAVPFGGKKKGADSGIDGLIYFKPEGKKTEKAIVSVKSGENVGVSIEAFLDQ